MKFETKQLSDGKLTTQMFDQYKSDGFLCPIKILEIEEACTLRKELELIEEKYSKIELPKPIMRQTIRPALKNNRLGFVSFKDFVDNRVEHLFERTIVHP